MIKASNATLQVKHRNGRYGTFSVADLLTEFGQFKVKDPVLDQFEEGTYQADVWIDEIYLGYYTAYGRGVNEIRARLHDLQVLDEDQRPAEPEQDMDPIEEEAQTPAAAPQPQHDAPSEPDRGQDTQPKAAAAQTASASRDSRWDKFKRKVVKGDTAPEPVAQAVPPESDSIYDDEALAAIEQFQPVKLDPTVDRALLRRQTAGLKELGYRFNSREQTWFADSRATAGSARD